jgi:hypothetical protein
MIKKIIIALVLLLVIVIAYNRIFNGPAALPSTGEYGYNCVDGTNFTMVPSSNMTSIQLLPATSSDFHKENTLMTVATKTGAEYQGNGITFKAAGETVTLQTMSTTTTCTPVQVQDEAPYNFGD